MCATFQGNLSLRHIRRIATGHQQFFQKLLVAKARLIAADARTGRQRPDGAT